MWGSASLRGCMLEGSGMPDLPVAGYPHHCLTLACPVRPCRLPCRARPSSPCPCSAQRCARRSRADAPTRARAAARPAAGARLEPADRPPAAQALALQLAGTLRERKLAFSRAGLVQGLLQEFSLSSQEGVALMCLAEALLRIPDAATRDRADPRQDRRAATGARTSGAARRCSSTPRPGGCWSPASSSPRTATRALGAALTPPRRAAAASR